jgi:endoglucanase
MQVPASTDPGLAPYQGMAFHKLQDAAWTGLPLAPAADPQPRELHRPSTAATLNLAAAAAQGSRLFYNLDRSFAARLSKAAKTAYAAAKRVPDLYAPGADGASGGGGYDDSNVADEFYWAATELYLTTGDKNYADDVVSSPLHTADVFDSGGAFGWQSVAGLARIDLATVPSRIPGRSAIRQSVLAGADKVLAVQKTQPYAQPYAPADGSWVWGSNSNLLNNLVLVGSAYDINGASKYRTAVLKGFDYILGRNALNLSYVTGYGTAFSENQHSRMYSNQLDPALPHPPAGSVAGGPNSGLQDPVATAKLKGCAPQFCYIDDINSYATNEVAINWNSTLSWVSSFVADLDNGSN